MAAELLRTRAVPADLEIRGADRRTIVGIAMPWDASSKVLDLGPTEGPAGFPRSGWPRVVSETFKRGAFQQTLAERGPQSIKLFVNHQRQHLPIGRATSLREDAAGLIGEWYVSRTTDGDQALELVKDGVVDGLSIGFAPLRDRWSADYTQVDRLVVKLREVSLVAEPAYEGARVVGVRNVPNLPVELAKQQLDLLRMRNH